MKHRWTHHGHACCKEMSGPRPEKMVIARCGGPGICKPCALDAARVHLDDSPNPETVVRALTDRLDQMTEELRLHKDGVVLLQTQNQLSAAQHDLLVARARIAKLQAWMTEHGPGRLRKMDPIDAAIHMLDQIRVVRVDQAMEQYATPEHPWMRPGVVPPPKGRPIRDDPQG